MSEIVLLYTESRWQRYVLVPLNIFFIAAGLVSFLNGFWGSGVAFVALVLYIGYVGSRLQIHRGKSFTQLSEGISPSLPPASESSEQWELSYEEIRSIAETMILTNYAIAVAAIVLSLAGGIQWYWAILIGIVVWLVGQQIGSLLIALLSKPPRRSNDDLGRNTEAIEAYKQAIHIKPDDAEAHYNLGLAYLSVGSKGFALDEYKVLKGLNKNLANELFNKIYR